MASKSNGFREDEIVVLKHWDKRDSKWVESVYPKVGGRLRLAHEDNEVLSISTDIVQYTEQIAVVKALVNTKKGEFSGFGMASVERDKTIARPFSNWRKHALSPVPYASPDTEWNTAVPKKSATWENQPKIRLTNVLTVTTARTVMVMVPTGPMEITGASPIVS